MKDINIETLDIRGISIQRFPPDDTGLIIVLELVDPTTSEKYHYSKHMAIKKSDDNYCLLKSEV